MRVLNVNAGRPAKVAGDNSRCEESHVLETVGLGAFCAGDACFGLILLVYGRGRTQEGDVRHCQLFDPSQVTLCSCECGCRKTWTARQRMREARWRGPRPVGSVCCRCFLSQRPWRFIPRRRSSCGWYRKVLTF